MAKFGPEWFVGYFPEQGIVHAAMDASIAKGESQQELYDRVNRWVTSREVVLGEGFIKSFDTLYPTYPVSLILKAPVVDPGILSTEKDTYSIERSS
jgi:hypothetical protein